MKRRLRFSVSHGSQTLVAFVPFVAEVVTHHVIWDTMKDYREANPVIHNSIIDVRWPEL